SLPDDPAGTLADTRFNFLWVGAFWSHDFNATVRMDGNRHRTASGIPQVVFQLMRRIGDGSLHSRQSGMRARAMLRRRSMMSSMTAGVSAYPFWSRTTSKR